MQAIDIIKRLATDGIINIEEFIILYEAINNVQTITTPYHITPIPVIYNDTTTVPIPYRQNIWEITC